MKSNTKDELKNFFSKLTIIKANFKLTLIVSIILMIYFSIMGFVIYNSSSSLFEFHHQIDGRCIKNKCEINFELKKDKNGPFYLYIGYKNFYLNHRNVAFSIDWNQINSRDFNSGSPSSRCKNYNQNKYGVEFYPEIFSKKDQDETMYPCGLFSLLYVECFLKR